MKTFLNILTELIHVLAKICFLYLALYTKTDNEIFILLLFAMILTVRKPFEN